MVQQKLRYGIVKNQLRNTQKQLCFDLKIANFLQLRTPIMAIEDRMFLEMQDFDFALILSNVPRFNHFCKISP